MSIESINIKRVERIKSTLENVLHHDRENLLITNSLFGDFMDAMSDLVYHKCHDLNALLFIMLDCKDECIREEVVKTLGYHSRLYAPEFKEIAYEMFKNDKSNNVRKEALTVWADYHQNKKDPYVLQELYNMILDDKEDVGLRATAYIYFLMVGVADDMDFNPYDVSIKVDSCSTDNDLNEEINWNKVDEVMNKYVYKNVP